MKAKQNLRNTTSRLDQASIKRDKKCEQHISIKPTPLTHSLRAQTSIVRWELQTLYNAKRLAGWLGRRLPLHARQYLHHAPRHIYTSGDIVRLNLQSMLICFAAQYIHALYMHIGVWWCSPEEPCRCLWRCALDSRLLFSFIKLAYGENSPKPETRAATVAAAKIEIAPI